MTLPDSGPYVAVFPRKIGALKPETGSCPVPLCVLSGPGLPWVYGACGFFMSEAAVHHHDSILPHDYPEDAHYGRASMGKLGMWIFLLSDAFSFGGLLLAYGILRGGHEGPWPPEGLPEFGINFTAGLTFILICSSVSMVMAYAACVEKNKKGMVTWLAVTVFGGCIFLCGQLQEYWGVFSFIFHHPGLVNEGLVWGESHYATTFYCITGFHGMHVTTGVIYLFITLIRAMMGKYDDGNYNEIEIAGLFWHFVDLVWILVFTFVYLLN